MESELVQKIRLRGYWEIEILPETIQPNRIDSEKIDRVIPTSAVRFRGWPVPYVDYREDFLRMNDYIGQDIDAKVVNHIEAWRLFRNGQFLQLRAVDIDWRGGDACGFTKQGHADVIEVWEILYYITEVYELAARLGMKYAHTESLTVKVKLVGTNGRRLIVGQNNRAEFDEPMISLRKTEISTQKTLSAYDWNAAGRDAAVDSSIDFFNEFGWSPPRDLISEHQRELIEK